MSRRTGRLTVAAMLLAIVLASSISLAAPLTLAERRTTDASIFLTNLASRIDAIERVLAKRSSQGLRADLAAELEQRGRILGRVDDFERALALTETADGDPPLAGSGAGLRARLLAYFHRFDEALLLLEETPEIPLRAEEASLLRGALGQYEELAPLPEKAPDGLIEGVRFAQALVERGQFDRAHAVLERAQGAYHDVSPFPLAWLHTQHGILYLRLGDLPAAQRYFEVARERLPAYYLATEHLAEVLFRRGDAARARVLYQEVAAQTGNPEFQFQLSLVERELGNSAEADRLLQVARSGYDDLLARHEAAFADHAARFFLAIGELERATELARRDLERRRSIEALLLVAEVESASGHGDAACRAWSEALATGLEPPELHDGRAAFANCESGAATGDRADADPRP